MILARSFIAFLPLRSGRQHAGDETCENVERRDARGFVELPPRRRQRRCWRGVRGKLGWIEEGQVQLHDRSPFAAPTRRVGAQSVDDLAQVKQIPEFAQIVVAIADIFRRRAVGPAQSVHSAGMSDRLPSGKTTRTRRTPRRRMLLIASQRLAFESVALAGDRHRIRNITTMGSLWPLPSTA